MHHSGTSFFIRQQVGNGSCGASNNSNCVKLISSPRTHQLMKLLSGVKRRSWIPVKAANVGGASVGATAMNRPTSSPPMKQKISQIHQIKLEGTLFRKEFTFEN